MNSLFGIEIEENNGMLSFSSLKNAYNTNKAILGLRDRNVSDIISSVSFVNFVKKHYDVNIFLDGTSIVKQLKEKSLWVTKGARHTKKVFCESKIWKYIYIKLFSEFRYTDVPKFISDIKLDCFIFDVPTESRPEISFIDQFIKSSTMLISNIEKQYCISFYDDNSNHIKFIYDLKFDIPFLNQKYLLEFNEKQHLSQYQIDIDKIKLEKAEERGFQYLYVPFDKIELQVQYIKDNLSDNLFNDLSKIKYDSDIPKYAEYINKKVLRHKNMNYRNMASYYELEKISEIEKHIMRMLEREYIKTQDQILLEISEFTK